jgi:hypothetical protein
MTDKGPMARMQLLLPPELKTEIEAFAAAHGVSANEAIRLLTRRGLDASGHLPPVSALVEELGQRVRELEQRLARLENRKP